MCWCRPEIRTPNCGRPECVPPQKTILEQIMDAQHRHSMALDDLDEARSELDKAELSLKRLRQKDESRRMRPAI